MITPYRIAGSCSDSIKARVALTGRPAQQSKWIQSRLLIRSLPPPRIAPGSDTETPFAQARSAQAQTASLDQISIAGRDGATAPV